MKTAMQELMEWVLKDEDLSMLPKTSMRIMSKATVLLEKEKQQMKEAHDHGYEIANSNLSWDMQKTWEEFLKQNNLFKAQ